MRALISPVEKGRTRRQSMSRAHSKAAALLVFLRHGQRNAPAPGFVDVFDAREHQKIHQRRSHCAERYACERQRRQKATAVSRGAYSVISTEAPACSAHAPNSRTGDQTPADADQCATECIPVPYQCHKGNRAEQDEFSPNLVAQDPKEDAPDGTDRKTQEIGGEAGKEANCGTGTREEQGSKDERRREAVEREILVLQRAANGARPCAPSEVRGGNLRLGENRRSPLVRGHR